MNQSLTKSELSDLSRFLPTQSDVASFIASLGPEEKNELDRLLAAPTKRSPPPKEFGEWLVQASPKWTWGWRHLVVTRKYLKKIQTGEIDRLMVFAPPRHGKSEMFTIRFPVFNLEHNPENRYIVGAYSDALAKKFTRRSKALLRERGYVPLNPEVTAAHEWETEAGGGMFGAGVGTGVTGRGADGIVIDDPVKSRKEANSLAYRNWVFDWYTDDLHSRLEPGGWMAIQMTRWHVDDLAGRILASPEGRFWTVLHMPALAERHDPLDRNEGEALCPQRYSRDQLLRIKEVMGRSFGALYQGNPVPDDGNIISPAWFIYYDEPAFLYRARVQSWDCANKAGELNAYSACTSWGISKQYFDLLHAYRAKLQFPQLVRRVKAMAEEMKPDAVLIEDKGNGTALIQTLRSETRIPVVPIEPVGDKVMRLSNESVHYETGTVRHPTRERAPWITDFEAELTAFPESQYLDYGDTVSQFLHWAKARLGNLDGFNASDLRAPRSVVTDLGNFTAGGGRVSRGSLRGF